MTPTAETNRGVSRWARTHLTVMSESRFQRGQQAFTLIELAVVIGVVAILSAMLLGAIGRTKDRARRIQCLSNVHQLGIHLAAFVADRGSYPLATFGSQHHMNQEGLWAIDPETSSRTNRGIAIIRRGGIWDCPSVQRPSRDRVESPFADYGYNGYGVGGPKTLPFPDGQIGYGLGGVIHDRLLLPVKESELVSPATTYALGDGLAGDGRDILPGQPILARRLLNRAEAPMWGPVSERHRGKSTVGFGDGHAESIPLFQLFGSDSEDDLRRWNRDQLPHRDRLKL